MKKYLLALVLSLFLCSLALAQEAGAPVDDEDEEEVETNAFGYPDKNLVKVIEAGAEVQMTAVQEKPACDDRRLVVQAQEVLKPYVDVDVYTIADKRKMHLVLKNVDNFTVLNDEDISLAKNRLLAARAVELKVNNALNDNNITVCQSDNPILGYKLYLMMYDDPQGVRVDVLNFSTRQTPSFIFQQN